MRRPAGLPGLLLPGFQAAGSPRAPADDISSSAKLRIAPAGLLPPRTAASLAALPPSAPQECWRSHVRRLAPVTMTTSDCFNPFDIRFRASHSCPRPPHDYRSELKPSRVPAWDVRASQDCHLQRLRPAETSQSRALAGDVFRHIQHLGTSNARVFEAQSSLGHTRRYRRFAGVPARFAVEVVVSLSYVRDLHRFP